MAFLDIGDGPRAVFAGLHKVQEVGAIGGRSKEFRLLVLDVLGIFSRSSTAFTFTGDPPPLGR